MEIFHLFLQHRLWLWRGRPGRNNGRDVPWQPEPALHRAAGAAVCFRLPVGQLSACARTQGGGLPENPLRPVAAAEEALRCCADGVVFLCPAVCGAGESGGIPPVERQPCNRAVGMDRCRHHIVRHPARIHQRCTEVRGQKTQPQTVCGHGSLPYRALSQLSRRGGHLDGGAAQRHRCGFRGVAVGGGRHRLYRHSLCDVQRCAPAGTAPERGLWQRPRIPGLRAARPHPDPFASALQRGEIQMVAGVTPDWQRFCYLLRFFVGIVLSFVPFPVVCYVSCRLLRFL